MNVLGLDARLADQRLLLFDDGNGVRCAAGQVAVPHGRAAQRLIVRNVGRIRDKLRDRVLAVEAKLIHQTLDGHLLFREAEAERVLLLLVRNLIAQRMRPAEVTCGRIVHAVFLRNVAGRAQRLAVEPLIAAIEHDVLERLPIDRHARSEHIADQRIVAERLHEVRQRHIERADWKIGGECHLRFLPSSASAERDGAAKLG